MGTLNGLMYAASSALAANQTALSATAENIGNQTTQGYSRRSVTWSEGDTVSVGSAASPGVRVSVTAQRDTLLQRAVQTATSAASASTARVSALDDVQSLFNIDSSGADASGIGPAVSGLFNSATALGASPNDGTGRKSVLTAAQTLASALNAAASHLSSQTSSLSQQVSDSVTQVNGLTSQIAALNHQIMNGGGGGNADTLVDQRDDLTTQLSKLVDVNTILNSDGTVNLALADGSAMVNGSSSFPLRVASVNGMAHVLTATAAGNEDVTSSLTGGSIGGMLAVRDKDIPAVRVQLDTVAATIANAVNGQNAAGTTFGGSRGGAIFSGSTAATITVVASGPDAVAASPDGSNAAALGALGNAALTNGKTVSDAFSAMITGLGNTAAAAGTAATANAAVLTQALTANDAVSGVSLDTEAANLTQYQRSYEAAAKLLAIVNELMAQAINLGTATTVS